MQVEGYSLEAQKERLRKYADFQEMVIVGEYSDEGKSGKVLKDGRNLCKCFGILKKVKIV